MVVMAAAATAIAAGRRATPRLYARYGCGARYMRAMRSAAAG